MLKWLWHTEWEPAIRQALEILEMIGYVIGWLLWWMVSLPVRIPLMYYKVRRKEYREWREKEK